MLAERAAKVRHLPGIGIERVLVAT